MTDKDQARYIQIIEDTAANAPYKLAGIIQELSAKQMADLMEVCIYKMRFLSGDRDQPAVVCLGKCIDRVRSMWATDRHTIEHLDINPRSYKCLMQAVEVMVEHKLIALNGRHHHQVTVTEILDNMTQADFMRIRGCGATTVDDLNRELKQLGYNHLRYK